MLLLTWLFQICGGEVLAASRVAPLLDTRLLNVVLEFGDATPCAFLRFGARNGSLLNNRSDLDVVAAAQPVVLTSDKDGPSVVWNVSGMVEAIGDVPVLMDNGRHDGARLKTRVTIKQYLEQVRDDGRNLHIFQAYPSLLHARLRSLMLSARPKALQDVDRRPIFTVGYEGTATFFHEHELTWQTLLIGRKAWFLAPPSSRHHEFMQPSHNPCEWLNESKRERLPPDAKFCVQTAGETLFFPAHWMHATCNLGPGATVGIGAQGDLSSAVQRLARHGDPTATVAAIASSKDVPRNIADALHDAATFGHTEIVKTLLDDDSALNLPKPSADDISHAAMSAAEAGQLDVLKIFTNAGVNLGTTSNSRRTLLWQAAWNGHASVVNFLAPTSQDKHRQEALDAAAVAGSLDSIDILLRLGAKPSGAVARAAAKSGHASILRALVKARARVDASDVIGWQPLHFASCNGHVVVVKELLVYGAPLEAPNGGDSLDLVDDFAFPLKQLSGGWRPAHLAAHSGHVQVLQLLFQSGAELNSTENMNRTPFQLAAEAGQSVAMQWLDDHRHVEEKHSRTANITGPIATPLEL